MTHLRKKRKKLILVATMVDAFTGREKLELLLVAASTKVLATVLVVGALELALLNSSVAFTTTEPWL